MDKSGDSGRPQPGAGGTGPGAAPGGEQPRRPAEPGGGLLAGKFAADGAFGLAADADNAGLGLGGDGEGLGLSKGGNFDGLGVGLCLLDNLIGRRLGCILLSNVHELLRQSPRQNHERESQEGRTRSC